MRQRKMGNEKERDRNEKRRIRRRLNKRELEKGLHTEQMTKKIKENGTNTRRRKEGVQEK